jgi:hypothetical protein
LLVPLIVPLEGREGKPLVQTFQEGQDLGWVLLGSLKGFIKKFRFS